MSISSANCPRRFLTSLTGMPFISVTNITLYLTYDVVHSQLAAHLCSVTPLALADLSRVLSIHLPLAP